VAISSAVVLPAKGVSEEELIAKLNAREGVEVSGRGEKGIAVVLEAEDLRALQRVSEEINDWKEVLEFQLVYYNWEEVTAED